MMVEIREMMVKMKIKEIFEKHLVQCKEGQPGDIREPYGIKNIELPI